ncbi:hypothetical protein [Dyadobacter fermentans]|uniref:Outer membrane protein beta-barrel domain-containing protein n=1 Tax=Dyadobacter fermentans (strain ATCC 700827 / DSM 18053 / CIP 107007 / KCTC 52180 / NS114) TaxID=471854 RepID=C6VUD9_DYAFD|nr:hypothetical protein [Dyadobacter fermentans]ACT96621.1 hypothetical protein Dfer_5428 [Dyadobacter fermentans DSM 18053]
MKKCFAFAVLFLISQHAFSQFNGSGLSVSVSYPMPVGNNFINKPYGGGEGYKGIIDVGIDYTVYRVANWDFGLLFNAAFFQYEPLDLSLNTISPKAKIGYTINLKHIALQPQIGIGYTNLRFTGPVIYGSTLNERADGIAGRASAKLIFLPGKSFSPYFVAGYEMNRIGKLTPETTNTSFNRNIQLLALGAGLSWNFGRKNMDAR